jgi:hypothetical protein
MGLYRESFLSQGQITAEKSRLKRMQPWRPFRRDDGEPEGRPFSAKGVCTLVQPLHRTIYWLVQPANGALVSCTKAPQIQPQRAKSWGGWVRERVAAPMASSVGPGRDVVAYLILGNYGGTMKGAGRLCSASAAIAPEPRRKANIPFDHTEEVERFAVHRRNWDANFGYVNIFVWCANLVEDTWN